ncbi:hypothetical protein Tco_0602994 [Tanacetum coccineum]
MADPAIKLRRETEVGPLSGKGPRVFVFADASVLPRSVFVRGSAAGAALKILTITSLKCVLTQEHLDAICAKYFVPEEVHPQLPSSDATMHERPTGKIGMYTRFFDYANYRIPFSTFFVSVLTHFRIPFSQLSVFGSAKLVSGANIVKEPHHGVCPSENKCEHINTLIAQASSFLRFPEEFLCWVGISPSPLEEGGDHTDSVTDPSLRTIGPSARFVVLSDSSHHSGTKSAVPEVDSLDKSVPHPSVFGSSSSSEKTDRTLSLFTGRSGSGFAAGSIRAEEAIGAGLEEIYVPEWTVTKGFELNDGRLCANMIDHFTPPAFFKTVRGMEHEQLFTEFNVSAARNLSLSSEVRMRAEYNILEKRKWKSLAEEKDCLLGARDKEIEELKSQLLKAKEESVEVAQLRARVSGLEATENSLRGEDFEKDHELSDLGASSSSLKSQNQSLVNQVHELETFHDLRKKLEMYEGSLKQLEEFQDNLMRPLKTRLAEIDADFTRCCMRFQESFHPHLLNVVAGRRWLLTHGMKLLVVKCLNSTEYMEALGHAFGRAIEKGMQEGLAAGIEHGQAGRCLTDLEAYIPSAEADFNSAIRDLAD